MSQTNYEWLDAYCLSQTGATTDYQPDWEATRYLVGGKMFAMRCGDKEGKPIITLKLEPVFGDLLRQQYEHIVPGYYMNKMHWNSLYLEGDVPDDVVQTMIRESHRLVLQSLSKKMQKEIELAGG
ncbi:MAG: MmcQ/YjbR family DNA-binding protein [Oscillospiraceae bacterium]|nr:MmcQ/YjbR family DNA-binding protein [Oscillospiraceae bacterium]